MLMNSEVTAAVPLLQSVPKIIKQLLNLKRNT